MRMKTICLVIVLLMIGRIGMSGCLAQSNDAVIPELHITRRPIPDNEAMEYLKALGVGWNLGNTFDAIKGSWNKNADEMTLETSWGVDKTNEAMFDALKAAGFSSVRIPVSWHDHIDGDDYRISEKWLDRVQEVVNWAYDRELHVILNIHHDEDQFLPSSAHYAESASYMASIWSQLAERFKDYDDRLILESMNEPRLIGSAYEWYLDPSVQECRDAVECLNRLNQLFVDTVRASGGNNAERYLMVPGYDASPDGALNEGFKLPQDSADNRIIVSVHAYTPYSFALEIGGTKEFGSQEQKREIVGFMNRLYERYIMGGIPVVIGEYGALRKGDNLQARVDWTAFYVVTASARNLPCLWWDNGGFQGNGELFGLMDRKKGNFVYPEIVDAIMTYAGYDHLPDTL